VGLRKLERWVVRSYLLSGPDYTLPRIKALFAWCRYYTSWCPSENSAPKLPHGLIGRTVGGPNPQLFFPWATGILAWMRDVPTGFGKVAPQADILAKLAFFAAGKRSLPQGSPKVCEEAHLRHQATLTGGCPLPPEELRKVEEISLRFGEAYMNVALEGMSEISAHLSLASSGCMENPTRKGGRALYISRKFTNDFLRARVDWKEREELLREPWEQLFSVEGFPLYRTSLEECKEGDFLAQILLKKHRDPDPLGSAPLSPEEKKEVAEEVQTILEKVEKLFRERVREKPMELLTLCCVREGLLRGRLQPPVGERQLSFSGLPWYKDSLPRFYTPGPHSVTARVVTLPEKGYKARVVTVAEGWHTILLHLPRSALYQVLSRDRRSTLFLKGKELFQMTRDMLYRTSGRDFFSLRRKRILGRLWGLSSDLSSATDETYREVYQNLLEGCRRSLLKRIKEGCTFLSMIPLASLSTRLNWACESAVEVKGGSSEEGKGWFGLEQKRGFLMGNPVSWFLLNLLNLMSVHLSRTHPQGPDKTLLQDLPSVEVLEKGERYFRREAWTKVCGDDLLTLTSLTSAHAYGSWITRFGNRLSEGAHIISPHTLIFVEDVAIREDRTKGFTPLDVVFLKSITLGRENKGDAGINVKKVPPLYSRGEALRRSMIYLPQPGEEDSFRGKERRRALAGLLYQAYRRTYESLRKAGVPLFLPRWCGGLEVPYYQGDSRAIRTTNKKILPYLKWMGERPKEEAATGVGVLSPFERKGGKGELEELMDTLTENLPVFTDREIRQEYRQKVPLASPYFFLKKGVWEPTFSGLRTFSEKGWIRLQVLTQKLEERLRRGVLPSYVREEKEVVSFRSLMKAKESNWNVIQFLKSEYHLVDLSRKEVQEMGKKLFKMGYLQEEFYYSLSDLERVMKLLSDVTETATRLAPAQKGVSKSFPEGRRDRE